MVFDHEDGLRESGNKLNQEYAKQRISGKCCPSLSQKDELIGKDGIRSDRLEADTPKRIGYMRVSTKSQMADRQVMQLDAHCDELHFEQISAVAAKRPVFDELMNCLRSGDTFVVMDLDRAFRSSIDAIMTAQKLRERSIKFKVLSFPIDTASEEGELFYHILAAFAQFERRIISRRTREGLEAAQRRGVKLGRPAQLAGDRVREAYNWMAEEDLPCRYVAALLGVSRLTLQRAFHREGLVYPPRN